MTFRQSQSNSAELLEIGATSPSESSATDYQTSNCILGPSAGMSQNWRFWKRFQFGCAGSFGYLYNYSRHQNTFRTLDLGINPELFPPAADPIQPTVQPSVRFGERETDHSLALLADGDIHPSFELFEHASVAQPFVKRFWEIKEPYSSPPTPTRNSLRSNCVLC